MPFLLPPVAPMPVRFVAKFVRAELHDAETVVNDASRDLSLVGMTSRSWGHDANRDQTVVVWGGRATSVIAEVGNWRPAPIALGRNQTLIVQSGKGYRSARLQGTSLLIGGATSRPRPTRRLSPFGKATVPGVLAFNRSPVQATWWRVAGVRIGSGFAMEDYVDSGSGIPMSRYVGKSYAKLADGQILPLAYLVRGKRPLREVLYVSREGWMVARTLEGFAWLYPVKA